MEVETAYRDICRVLLSPPFRNKMVTKSTISKNNSGKIKIK